MHAYLYVVGEINETLSRPNSVLDLTVAKAFTDRYWYCVGAVKYARSLQEVGIILLPTHLMWTDRREIVRSWTLHLLVMLHCIITAKITLRGHRS